MTNFSSNLWTFAVAQCLPLICSTLDNEGST